MANGYFYIVCVYIVFVWLLRRVSSMGKGHRHC